MDRLQRIRAILDEPEPKKHAEAPVPTIIGTDNKLFVMPPNAPPSLWPYNGVFAALVIKNNPGTVLLNKRDIDALVAALQAVRAATPD